MSGKGAAAKRVYDIMMQHRQEREEKGASQPQKANKVRAQINKLILIDRFTILLKLRFYMLASSLDLRTSSPPFLAS